MNRPRFDARRRDPAARGRRRLLPRAPTTPSRAEFDANRPLLLRGQVTKVEWVNPHAWIHVVITTADGKTEEWMVEAGTPNTLLRRGITKHSLLPGIEIVVDGYQSKDLSRRANGRDMTFPDGRKIFMGSSGTGAPRDGKDPTEPPQR